MASPVMDDDNDTFDESLLRRNLNQIQNDVIKLVKDLNNTYNSNPNNQRLHDSKMKNSLSVLESLDAKLFDVYNSLTSNDQDDLASNFGISVKLEMAKEKFDVLKQKHNSLKKEWHNQDKHLNKISANITKKENELKMQSALCTIQGVTMGKILWKFSKNNELLEVLVSNNKLALDLVKIYSGCLYGFIRTFENDLPDPLTDEYQFVLCLTGIMNNFASIPDGRFFLLHEPTSRQVLNQVIKTIPFISVRNGKELKFLTVSTVYNIMICQEGEEFLLNNCYLVDSLKNCLEVANSDRIILMSLKIITNLLKTKKCVMNKFDTLFKLLKKLSRIGESHDVRCCAKNVLTLLHEKNICKAAVGIDTSELVKDKSRKLSSRKGKSNNVTCCVVTDTNIRTGFNSKKHPATFSELCRSVLESDSSSTSFSSVTNIKESSNSFLLPKFTDLSNSESEPITLQKQKITSRPPCPAVSSKTNTHSNSALCTNVEPQQKPEKLVELENVNSIESEELQNVVYQFPLGNIEKTFSLTIGDHMQNTRTRTTTVRDAHHTEGEAVNTSTVTVYRMNNSQLLAMSDNSFFPFTPMYQNNDSSLIAQANLKFAQGLTNIIVEHEIENIPTTSKHTFDQDLCKNLVFADSISSVEDFFENTHRRKLKNLEKSKRTCKKTRNGKNKVPVFKVPFRSRRRI
ncbi:hypothetical protein FQR65_LT12546 [Abscondita terminalis]|nr:hypothetical protein FQR65_LT12546 [Abscondita terminalis]